MKKESRLSTRLIVGALLLTLSAGSGLSLAGSCSASPRADIVATAQEAGGFNTLIAAVQAAGLVDALRGDGPLTVFAPSDEAFAKLPAGTLETLLKPENRPMLEAILTYHVAPGSLTADRIVALDRIKTLNGQRPEVTVGSEGVMIGQAKVTATDIMSSNGVIHVIDTVLLPREQDIVETAVSAGNFSTLTAALEAADLVNTLQGEGPFTVFAPTDEAFAKLPRGTVESLLEPGNRDQLISILTDHVVAGDIYSSEVRPGRVTTLGGRELVVSTTGGKLMVDQARIVAADIETTNGVIHVIDEVIIPGETRSSHTQEAQELIRVAIDRGAPMYNHGNAAACAAIYEVASRGLMSSGALSEQDRRILETALNRMHRTGDAGRQAWIMRDALDQVMESLSRSQMSDARPMRSS